MSCYECARSPDERRLREPRDFLVCHGHGVFHGYLSQGAASGWSITLLSQSAPDRQETSACMYATSAFSTKRHTLRFRL